MNSTALSAPLGAPVIDERRTEYIRYLMAKNGPEPADYADLTAWLNAVYADAQAGLVSRDELLNLRQLFGEAMTRATLQGFVCEKPHGYAGDYEIIDMIYRQYVTPAPQLRQWDEYFHEQPAPRAVRNRKTYFHELLSRHAARCRPLQVLNVASGPGRCMYEWLVEHPHAAVRFDCVELDPNAITYATDLNQAFADRITFTRQNILRYTPKKQYDLIWAAGICDYFADPVFTMLVRNLHGALAPGGELVVGNFSIDNPTRPYMELIGEWVLHHRSADDLIRLALGAGIPAEQIRVGSEAEGINLFLHATR